MVSLAFIWAKWCCYTCGWGGDAINSRRRHRHEEQEDAKALSEETRPLCSVVSGHNLPKRGGVWGFALIETKISCSLFPGAAVPYGRPRSLPLMACGSLDKVLPPSAQPNLLAANHLITVTRKPCRRQIKLVPSSRLSKIPSEFRRKSPGSAHVKQL